VEAWEAQEERVQRLKKLCEGVTGDVSVPAQELLALLEFYRPKSSWDSAPIVDCRTCKKGQVCPGLFCSCGLPTDYSYLKRCNNWETP